MMSHSLFAAVPWAALLLDTVFGDPRSSLHPVVLIGKSISFYEGLLYPKGKASSSLLFCRGILLWCAVMATTVAVAALLQGAAFLAGGTPGYLVMAAVILYFTITPRSLARDGLEIYHLLREGRIVEARKRLSWIVGRDTDKLDEGNVTRGVVETVAENTVDGVISPLFWFFLLGPLGAAAYRAANTMDSMVGYRNERYLYFGRCGARMDDVLNYIPARVTYLLFGISAFLAGYDWRRAFVIGFRDAPKHPSPNGGWAEATVAGALHIRLGGYNYYQGEPEFRAYMGDPIESLRGIHIRKTLVLMYTATVLFVAAGTLFSLWF